MRPLPAIDDVRRFARTGLASAIWPMRRRGRRGRLAVDERGTAAIEFAILLPVLFFMTFNAITFGLALWSWNVLEEASAEAARCLAIGSSVCGSSPVTCSAEAGLCFVMQLSSDRGLPGIGANQVTIDSAAIIDGVSYTTVRIAYPFTLLGYQMTLTSTNRFPNQG